VEVSYRKELEKAARRMILIHRTDTLVKLILRAILKSLKITHAGIFLYDRSKGVYILTVSRGKKGIKIPAGFVKLPKDSPLIKYFSDKKYRLGEGNFLIAKRVKMSLRTRRNIEGGKRLFLNRLVYLMSIYKITSALPIFFREDLLGVLILGNKLNKKEIHPQELSFLSILSSDVAMAIQNATLFDQLKFQLERNQTLFLQTVSALAEAIEAKDRYTLGHTQRVANYSLEIANCLRKYRRLKNWQEFKENLRIAALLHDIGKIGIPENVLNKRSPLCEEEKELIRRHPEIGVEILNPIKEFKDIILGIKYHHERYDGKGYPCGIKGKKIPLIASIIAVADSFDAMTSERPYRRALSKEEAIRIIKENRGKQFSPVCVDAFLNSKIVKGIWR